MARRISIRKVGSDDCGAVAGSSSPAGAVETLFGSLKVERLRGQYFETRRQGKGEALNWLLWYNQAKLDSPLNYVNTPLAKLKKGREDRKGDREVNYCQSGSART